MNTVHKKCGHISALLNVTLFNDALRVACIGNGQSLTDEYTGN